MASLERTHFFGCTLTKEKPEIKWDASDDDLENEIDIINQLALSQACLGPKAKANSSHVVQVTTTGVNGNKVTQPILILGEGTKQVQCRLEFSSSATFKLIEGHGPVHLSGSHIQVLSGYASEESDDEGIETQSPEIGKKKPSPSPSKQPPAKRAKIDLENVLDEESSDDDEPETLIPIKDDKSKKTDKTQKKDQPQAKKGKPGLFDKEAQEISDSEEDEDDEDFQAGDINMDDDEDDDDEDDEDEDDDDDDEEDDSDVSYEDEAEKAKDKDFVIKTPSPKKKGGPKENGTPKVTRSTPGQGSDKKTPKKPNTPATQGPPDIDTVKQRLLKSPNLPKKVDKFRNFMKTNLKITEDKTVRELWAWLQKNKK